MPRCPNCDSKLDYLIKEKKWFCYTCQISPPGPGKKSSNAEDKSYEPHSPPEEPIEDLPEPPLPPPFLPPLEPGMIPQYRPRKGILKISSGMLIFLGLIFILVYTVMYSLTFTEWLYKYLVEWTFMYSTITPELLTMGFMFVILGVSLFVYDNQWKSPNVRVGYVILIAGFILSLVFKAIYFIYSFIFWNKYVNDVYGFSFEEMETLSTISLFSNLVIILMIIGLLIILNNFIKTNN